MYSTYTNVGVIQKKSQETLFLMQEFHYITYFHMFKLCQSIQETCMHFANQMIPIISNFRNNRKELIILA